MIEKLTVFHDDDGSFTDFTQEAHDFSRDVLDFGAVVAADDHIYLGRYKMFNAVYIEMSTASTTSTSFTAEYYNGTTWTALTLQTEDTKAFQRSGYIKFTKPDDWDEVAINSSTKYYIRLVPGSDMSAGTEVQGINLVFADDQDIKSEAFELVSNTNMFPSGQNSHILTHFACMNDIIQKLRNSGHAKVSSSTGNPKNLDPWDFHDIDEIRNAAKHLAISKIYMNLADEVDDINTQKARHHMGLHEESMRLFYLSLDTDDDGVHEIDEKLMYSGGTLIRG